jgi:hypothetical protein
MREFKTLLVDSLIYIPSRRMPVRRRRAVRSQLALLGEKRADWRYVEIESLLEGEAAATSFIQTLNLPKDEDQSAIARRNAVFYQPYAMPPRYRALWLEFATFLGKALNNSVPLLTIAEIACQYLRLFVDLALAYPSPRLFEEAKLNRKLYEPGIKLMYLTRAYHAIPESKSSAFIKAFERDPFAIEDILLAHCEERFLSSREIYKDWLDVFEREVAIEGDPLARLRVDACRQRLENPLTAKNKSHCWNDPNPRSTWSYRLLKNR